METENETDAVNKELLNKIFQEMAHLTKSVMSINDRLDRIEITTGRLQDRLSDLQDKYMQKMLAIEDKDEKKKT